MYSNSPTFCVSPFPSWIVTNFPFCNSSVSRPFLEFLPGSVMGFLNTFTCKREMHFSTGAYRCWNAKICCNFNVYIWTTHFEEKNMYRGFSRDVTRSRVCLVTPLIRHFGGQSSAVVCAACALQCVVYIIIYTSYQPACGVACMWMSWKGIYSVSIYDFQTRLPWSPSSALQWIKFKSVGRAYL